MSTGEQKLSELARRIVIEVLGYNPDYPGVEDAARRVADAGLADLEAKLAYAQKFLADTSLCEGCQVEREKFLRKLGAGQSIRMQLAAAERDLTTAAGTLREEAIRATAAERERDAALREVQRLNDELTVANSESENALLQTEVADLRRQLADLQRERNYLLKFLSETDTARFKSFALVSSKAHELDAQHTDLQRQYERLQGAAELACISMEERGYGDMPSIQNLRAQLDQPSAGPTAADAQPSHSKPPHR